MKITAKTFASFKRAQKLGINGISFNDAWNLQTFGITKRQYDALEKCASDIHGGAGGDLTLPELNRFLAGDKVQGARAHPDLLAGVTSAFS